MKKICCLMLVMILICGCFVTTQAAIVNCAAKASVTAKHANLTTNVGTSSGSAASMVDGSWDASSAFVVSNFAPQVSDPVYITFEWDDANYLTGLRIATCYASTMGIKTFDVQYLTSTGYVTLASNLNTNYLTEAAAAEFFDYNFPSAVNTKGLRLKVTAVNYVYAAWRVEEILIYQAKLDEIPSKSFTVNQGTPFVLPPKITVNMEGIDVDIDLEWQSLADTSTTGKKTYIGTNSGLNVSYTINLNVVDKATIALCPEKTGSGAVLKLYNMMDNIQAMEVTLDRKSTRLNSSH